MSITLLKKPGLKVCEHNQNISHGIKYIVRVIMNENRRTIGHIDKMELSIALVIGNTLCKTLQQESYRISSLFIYLK